MATILFIFIGYLRRKKFIPEGVEWSDKMLYYICCIFLTPIFGPYFFRGLMEAKPSDPNKPSRGIYTYVE